MPTPTREQTAAAHLSEIIPWFRHTLDPVHSQAAETITGIWLRDAELGDAIAKLSWVADGVSPIEWPSLDALAAIAEAEPGLAMLAADSAWFADGLDYDDPYGSERSALQSLSDISHTIPELVDPVRELRWITEGLTSRESAAIRYLVGIAGNDVELAVRMAGAPWVTDGIDRHEMNALNDLVFMSARDPEFTRRIIEATGADASVRDRDVYLITSLFHLGEDDPAQFEQLVSQPWFTDGLSPEERSFIVALNPAPYGIFDDLLESRFAQSATITLPLAGEVNLWAFQNTPFAPDEDLLGTMEEAVRGAESLLGAPFPTTDVIVLALGGSDSLGGFAGVLGGNHVRVARYEDFPLSTWLIYHEIAHFYFTGLGIGPPWLLEGGADFAAAYSLDRTGAESLETQLATSEESKQRNCVKYGIETIAGISSPDLPDPSMAPACNYILGRHFLISLFQTLGEAAVSSALRELYVLAQSDAPNPTDEDVYRVFLKHTPPGLEPAFRDLYRQLHGGPFVDP